MPIYQSIGNQLLRRIKNEFCISNTNFIHSLLLNQHIPFYLASRASTHSRKLVVVWTASLRLRIKESLQVSLTLTVQTSPSVSLNSLLSGTHMSPSIIHCVLLHHRWNLVCISSVVEWTFVKEVAGNKWEVSAQFLQFNALIVIENRPIMNDIETDSLLNVKHQLVHNKRQH